MTAPFEWTPHGPRALDALVAELHARRAEGAQVVTTNGCFDVLHTGHVNFLREARAQGDVLVVGLNGDASVQRLKGAGRPVVGQDDRAAMLAALRVVDYVVIFDDLTPNELLARLQPAIHCKAGDYTVESLPETPIVERGGGEVRILPLVEGYSTSQLIERVMASASGGAAQDTAPRGRSSAELMLADANLVRQTAYALRDQVAPAARVIGNALKQGNSITVVGNRLSGALVEAAGLDYDVFLPPGREGDVMLVTMIEEPPPELPHVVQAGRERGLIAVALLGPKPSPLADVADICLRLPVDEPDQMRLAIVTVLRAIGEIVRST